MKVIGKSGLLVSMALLFSWGCSSVQSTSSSQTTLDLQGEWSFALDRDDVGIAEQWFDRRLPDSIHLPGSLQMQGYGDVPSTNTQWLGTLYDNYWYLRAPYKKYAAPDNFKIPYWLQPERHYVGAAWYSRSFEIPEDWNGKHIRLFLERVHWSSTVWIDGEKIGFDDCLSAPHLYELGMLEPGRHTISIRIDNRMLKTIRADAHSITDSTQTDWNGIVGRIELQSTTPVYIADAKVFSDIDAKTVTFKVKVGNITGKTGSGMLAVGGIEKPVSWTADGAQTEITVPLPRDTPLWDEFTPVLHLFELKLTGTRAEDKKDLRVGLRKPESRDARFYMNGRRVFFRGTHEGCTFPMTGYPPTDVESWRKIFRTVKAYGLNHVRFHSWCPPEAAFTAADELGIYLQPECSNWGQYGSEKEELLEWLERETQKLIDAYGNHPSFVLFSTGNEPAGSWQEPLLDWTRRWKEKDNRFLYASQTGRYFGNRPGPVSDIDYLVAIRIGTYRFRGDQGWHGRDFRASLDGVNYPVISHETGQWCAFPDFSEIKEYTGFLKAKNFEIFRNSLQEHGMLDMAHDFLMASGKFQLECYKQEIEAQLRTPGMGGFQLLDLHDYPGQGTALVGLLNVFWESKGYVTPKEFRHFCNATVPLARMTKNIYRTNETLEVPLEVAHFGAEPLLGANTIWVIADAEGNRVKTGIYKPRDIPIGNGTSLGNLSIDLSTFVPNRKYTLTVSFLGPIDALNRWEFWVYPAEDVAVPEGEVVVTRSFDEALSTLKAGGKVLWMPNYSELSWDCPPVGRLPIFWSRLMGPKWERFLGIWCDPEHPALAGFTTDYYCDWQWQDVIIPYFRAINLDHLPGELKPIVQVIDDWNRNYKLAAVFECRVGEGRLLVCGPDLESDLPERPVARQLRNSLLDYMNSEQFNPSVAVTTDQLKTVFFDNRIMRKLGARAAASSETQKREVDNLIDGNPNSYWLSAFSQGHPHEVTISFSKPVPFSGLILMNRQDQRAHEGDIRGYEILVSEDDESWMTIASGALESTFDPQRIEFGKSVTASQLKLRALSGFGEDAIAALAEIAVLYEGPKLDVMLDDAGPYKKVVSATKEMDEDIEYVNKFIERIVASGEKTPAVNVQDGDSSSCWSADIQDGEAWITLKLNRPVNLIGISYLPRQGDDVGRIKEYVVEVSADGENWTQAARGAFEPGAGQQSVDFEKPVGGSALRLRAFSSQDGSPTASAAEIDIQTMD